MEMHQVRYFLALCETKNFTRAAERCNVSQPSLTRAIKLLEDELGGPLFNRERNNSHLSELGRVTEPHLRELWAQAQATQTRAKAFAKLHSAKLKLGITRGAPLAPLDRALSSFLTGHPDAEITLIEDRPKALADALRGGDLEIVVVPARPHDIDDLHYYPITQDRLQVVLPADHRLAADAVVDLAALEGEPLICCEACELWEATERLLAERHLGARPRVMAANVHWLHDLVRAGAGVGVLSAGARLGVLEGLETRLLAEPLLDRSLNLATKRGRLYSPPVKAFVDIALRPSRPWAESTAA